MKIINSKKTISKLLAAALTLCMVAGIFCVTVTVPVYADGVKLGQANCGEGGKLRGCSAGDQTGKEVAISGWQYSGSSSSSFHWVYVFRAKDPEVARKMADAMKEAAANSCVGYDQKQPDRFSFYDQAKAVDWDIAAISNNCETTCASAVSVCANAAGIPLPRMLYSGIVYREVMKTGAFDCLTDSSYTASSANLLPGDILCNPKRHTAMVVESPNPFVYEVEYNDTKGEEQIEHAEEGSTINLNLNNGEKSKSITADSRIDLEKYEPEKEYYEFTGWDKTGDNAFSAKYQCTIAPVALASGGKGDMKPIGKD